MVPTINQEPHKIQN